MFPFEQTCETVNVIGATSPRVGNKVDMKVGASNGSIVDVNDGASVVGSLLVDISVGVTDDAETVDMKVGVLDGAVLIGASTGGSVTGC